MTQRVRPSRTIDGITHWRCSRCKQWKPEDAFRPIPTHPSTKCGRCSRCRACESEAAREYAKKPGSRARPKSQATLARLAADAARQSRFRANMIARGFMQPTPVLREIDLPPLKFPLYGRVNRRDTR